MNNELLAVLEYMERERGIERESLIQALESALLSAARKSVVESTDIRINIDRETYDIKAIARKRVVEKVKNQHDEISWVKARMLRPEVQLGGTVDVEVTPKNFGRIAAQTAKQAIMHKIRQAEKERVYDEYRDSAGDIVSGAVRRFERGDVVVDLGRAEGLMPMRERVPIEEYQVGDRLRAYVVRVDNTPQGAEIILSRSHPNFVRRLFELEVSEISDGTVEIKGIAREAGFRSKIAVHSHDEKVDPVGACVGMRGIRVKNIVRELSGEKIDIVRWSDDIRTFVTNSLAPAKLRHVSVEEAEHKICVQVDNDQLSLAIGKKGQNARLTAKLTGWKVDIQREETDGGFAEKVAKAVADLAQLEGVGPELAEKLVHGGFASMEGIVTAELEDIAALDGFDAELASQVHQAVEKAYEAMNGPIED
ncbi:MAG: transcription termination factor NusA [Kiritimatiellae bacterium]|nr:transcription termination factor NusA [Kiritimatiellia bacterium]MDD4734496.1 transcription termination factor NusA [Kiritimatiellia bacterium]